MTQLENRVVGLLEDDPLMGESLSQRLSLEGFDVRWWQTGREAVEALAKSSPPDALICDIRLPDMSGEDVFRSVSASTADLPVLFMTAYGDIDQAVQLMRSGAADYITKPFDMGQFLDRLASMMRDRRGEGGSKLGVSAAMREVEYFLTRIAGQSGPLLITGETGVGKEVSARHLHALSNPKSPFVAVNCAAIPADLLESEIFGHEKGAFTGAQNRHLGYAERARDGILFLDEIGEMPTSLQAKLLRLIEDRSFHRIGGETPVPFRARVVTATNRDLSAAISEGRFREDLLFRLDTFSIEIPPLRKRPEDIGWLLDRFVGEFLDVNAGRLRGVSALAVEAALGHDWPGNARELRNRIERAIALAAGELLMPADLFPPRRGGQAETSTGPLADIRDAAERRAIEGALRDTAGQVQEAARLLGISRTTLWEKMKRLGLSD
jgi:two-component system, NtrC family, response regulator HydG